VIQKSAKPRFANLKQCRNSWSLSSTL